MHTLWFPNSEENVKHLSTWLLVLMPVDDYHNEISRCLFLKLKEYNNIKKRSTTIKSNYVICGIFGKMYSNQNTVTQAWVGGCLLLWQPFRFVFNYLCPGTKAGTTPLMMNVLKMTTSIPASPCCSRDIKPEGSNVILMSRRMLKASLSSLGKWDVSLRKVRDLFGQKVNPEVIWIKKLV